MTKRTACSGLFLKAPFRVLVQKVNYLRGHRTTDELQRAGQVHLDEFARLTDHAVEALMPLVDARGLLHPGPGQQPLA